MQPMYYIGLDVHKRKISYCVKDGSGRIHGEGSIYIFPSRLEGSAKTIYEAAACGLPMITTRLPATLRRARIAKAPWTFRSRAAGPR